LHCHFLSKTILADIDGLDDDIDKFNFLDKDTTTSNTALDFIHFRKYYATIEKPVIVMLYAPSDGVANANLLLNILKRYKSGIEIILITPNMGSNHPIFSDSKSISGFILPGGPNVDDDNFIQRKTFETFIIETALQNKTPLLGICRGHQVIGKYFGGKIKSLNNHEADTILVKKKDSELYRFVEKKYNKSSSDTRYVNMQKPLIAKDDSANKIVYSYLSSCLHKQGVFFNNDKIKNGISVKVVAKAKDGVSEALEINGHIVTYQHHHEDYYDQHQNNPQGKLAKSLIKKFVNMTIDYYQPRDNFNRKIVL
jgi:putative glutamine amidotransferase